MENHSPEQPESAGPTSGGPAPVRPLDTHPGTGGAPMPQQIVIQQSSSGFLVRLIASVGWLGFLFCGMLVLAQFTVLAEYFDTTGGITEKYHSLSKSARDKVAIISVKGVIMTGDGYVKRQIDRVRDDKNVKALVLRVDSPGGTVTGADYIYHHLKKLREERDLPMVVSMGSVAASGGYYVSMAVGDQEKCIYAEPTTTTGSIGVVIPHYDVSGLLERFDIKDDSIASHPRKEMLSMTKPMEDDQREIIKAYLDEAFQRFKSIVQSGRTEFQKDAASLDKLATGEIFTANQAKKNGLVDEIGFVEDAIDRVIEIAGLNKDKTRVVEFERPVSLFDLGLVQSRSNSTSLSDLLEFSAPRPFYLWTSLPPLMSSDSVLIPRLDAN